MEDLAAGAACFASHPEALPLILDFHRLQCLNRENRLGLYDHTHLAVTPHGLSLGVVGVEYFDRDEEGLGQSSERSKLPIEEKESLRWLTGYRLACELARISRVASRAARFGVWRRVIVRVIRSSD